MGEGTRRGGARRGKKGLAEGGYDRMVAPPPGQCGTFSFDLKR